MSEFSERLRFVLQAHEREMIARQGLTDALRESVAASASRIESPFLDKKVAACREALTTANATLDEAIEQLEQQITPPEKQSRRKP